MAPPTTSSLEQTTAVILAGGFGTRIRHLLPDVPKPMARVQGKPFLEWLVRYLARQGVRQAIISTGYLAEVVEQHFREHPVAGVRTRCVAETAPLGTGGGFLNAIKACEERPENWLILNGDTLAFADLRNAAALLDNPEAQGVIIGRPVPDASRYGTLVVGASGELVRFDEKRPGQGIINTGISLLRQGVVPRFPGRLPLSLEQDVFPALTAAGVLLKVRVMDAPFLDIGTPESLPQAEAFIQSNLDQFSAL